jgi:hypothetical protein
VLSLQYLVRLVAVVRLPLTRRSETVTIALLVVGLLLVALGSGRVKSATGPRGWGFVTQDVAKGTAADVGRSIADGREYARRLSNMNLQATLTLQRHLQVTAREAGCSRGGRRDADPNDADRAAKRDIDDDEARTAELLTEFLSRLDDDDSKRTLRSLEKRAEEAAEDSEKHARRAAERLNRA